MHHNKIENLGALSGEDQKTSRCSDLANKYYGKGHLYCAASTIGGLWIHYHMLVLVHGTPSSQA